jgi:hypothetical protein
MHDIPIGGHLGMNRTYDGMKPFTTLARYETGVTGIHTTVQNLPKEQNHTK